MQTKNETGNKYTSQYNKNQQTTDIKKDSTQPITNYQKTTKYGNVTYSSNQKANNSSQYKITINKGQSGKDYSTISNPRSKNIGSKASKLQESIQKINNYRLVNKEDQSKSDKITNSKEIDHKKYGIRKKKADSTPPASEIEDNNIIIIKDNTSKNNIVHKKYGIRKRQADTTPPVSEREENNIIIIKDNTSKNNIDHKKYGIRKRQADTTPPVSEREDNNIIIINDKTSKNNIDHKKYGIRKRHIKNMESEKDILEVLHQHLKKVTII